MLKILNVFISYFGIITIIVFLFLIIFGSILDPRSQLLFREISYFISPYMSGKKITIPLFQLYNLTLIVFSLGLSLRMHNIFAKFGSLSLALSGVVGIILIWFPMAPPHMPQTIDGLLHVFTAFIMSFCIVTAILFFGKAFEHMANLAWLSQYSFGISLILFLSTIVTGLFAVFQDSSLVGLTEKLSLGAFFFWILLVAVGILRSDKRVNYNLP